MPTDRKKPPIVPGNSGVDERPFVVVVSREAFEAFRRLSDPPASPRATSGVRFARVSRAASSAPFCSSRFARRANRAAGDDTPANPRVSFVESSVSEFVSESVASVASVASVVSVESLEPSAARRDDRRGAARSVPVADTARSTRHRACALDAARFVAPGVSWTRRSPDPRRSDATARPRALLPHADAEGNPTCIGRAPRRAPIDPVGPRANPGARAAGGGGGAGTGAARTAGGIVRNRDARRAVGMRSVREKFSKSRTSPIDIARHVENEDGSSV